MNCIAPFHLVPSAILLSCLGGLGCASLPATGVQATGAPLGVQTGTVIEHHQVSEKVGDVEHTDSSGRTVGRSAVYANRTVTTERDIWFPTQGGQRIDDKDFFTIAGDREAADEVQRYREKGITMNRVGLVTAGIGIAALVGGYVLMSNSSPESNPDGSASAPRASTGSTLGGAFMLAGGVAIPVGALLAWAGGARQKRDRHPVDDPARLQSDADRYNRDRGLGAPPPAFGPTPFHARSSR